MLNKKYALFCLACLITTGIFCHHVDDFTRGLERNFDNQQTRSFDMVLYFIKHAYEICSAIDHLKPEIESKIAICCDGCKTKKISCAEFGGHLCAAMGIQQMDNLKELIIKGDPASINSFMQTVANEQKIVCIECKKFVHWSS